MHRPGMEGNGYDTLIGVMVTKTGRKNYCTNSYDLCLTCKMQQIFMIDKAALAKLSMTKVGGKANRLMGESSNLNRFLAAQFTIPQRIRESAKWVQEQTFGCANKADISELVNTALKKSAKEEYDSAKEKYSAMEMTKEQKKLLPVALSKYEEYLNEYSKKLDILSKALKAFEEKQAKNEPAVETVEDTEQVEVTA